MGSPTPSAYVDGGWGTIGVVEAWGGQGLPFAVQTAVLETLGTANMAFALRPTLTVGAIEALQYHGSPDQQRLFLPHLATGDWTGTMNLTEPQADSDVGALRTTATPLGDGTWSIKGTEIYISFGDDDMTDNIVHLVLARTVGVPPGTRGISLSLVPKYRLDDEGLPGAFNDVHVVSIEHKLGLHASPTCVLAFGDAGNCIRGADRVGTRRPASDVHDDEQRPAQRRTAGRPGRGGCNAGRRVLRAGSRPIRTGGSGQPRPCRLWSIPDHGNDPRQNLTQGLSRTVIGYNS